MRNIQKRICFLLIIVAIFSLGCARDNSTFEDSTIESNTEGIYSEEELDDARAGIEILIQAINKRDIELFKSTLTDVTIQNTINLDAEIQTVFDMYVGDVVEYTENKVECVSKAFGNEQRNVLILYYDVHTTEKEYLLDIIYIPKTNDEYKKTGFFSVVLSDYDRTWKYFETAMPSYYNNFGVFSSDVDTLDFNETKIETFYEGIGLEQCQLAVKFELNKAGIEKIDKLEVAEITEWGGVNYYIVDDIGNRYYIKTDEIGFVRCVKEIDENGKIIYGE